MRTWTLAVWAVGAATAWGQALPGTQLLPENPDWAKTMVQGIDRYLDRATRASVLARASAYAPDFASAEAYSKSLDANRARLRRILGLVDERVAPVEFQRVETAKAPHVVGATDRYVVRAVRWPALAGVSGEGLLYDPVGPAKGSIVAIPDADETPEEMTVAQQFADAGFRVIVPTLIDRRDTWSNNPRVGRQTNQTHREFVWRMAYQMGRHPLGFELQKVFAAIDGLRAIDAKAPIGVYGRGEGGMLALCAAALDGRIAGTAVVGHFGPRENLHAEPIARDVWRLLTEFGDGELARLIAPRALFVEAKAMTYAPPPTAGKGRGGAAPGTPAQFTRAEAQAELDRATKTFPASFARAPLAVVDDGAGSLIQQLGVADLPPSRPVPTIERRDPTARQKRQFDEVVAFTQRLLPDAAVRRQGHVWSKLALDGPANFAKAQATLRERFWNETIGRLPERTKALNPRSRLAFETPKFKAYDVVLELHDDVIAHGMLLVPTDLNPGEKRPTVVCQHGLEGRPTDVADPKKKSVYHAYAAQLADRGFVVFAPQAPYIFQNEFRQTVRKMHPLGLTIYAFIVRQHEAILDFLDTLPFVDARRIGFYGLSYGGKVAVRIPAILTRYACVICSGDFNEWIWKNITLDWAGSYMFTGEYEMFEFDLGNTFNYAEMTALIAPRPFMVERGHDDGVGLDEYVAFEFAKTRRFYSRLETAGLGRESDAELEFFRGGHEIHGRGTFAFLLRHLGEPRRP